MLALTTQSVLSNTALIAAGASIVLWMLTRVYEAVRDGLREKSEQISTIRSLFAEVDFNTRDLEFFLKNSAGMAQIEARLRQSDLYLPHVTDAKHTVIYTSGIGRLYHLPDGITGRLVLFYGLLDKIKAQIDGLNLTSYQRISTEGRIAVLKQILANVGEARDEGEAILTILTDRYTKLTLVRHARRHIDTRQR